MTLLERSSTAAARGLIQPLEANWRTRIAPQAVNVDHSSDAAAADIGFS
jgi:hypothetical protein